MELQEVLFVIDKQGNLKLDVQNGSGPSCKDLTENIERALQAAGATEFESGDKPELYEMNDTIHVTDFI